MGLGGYVAGSQRVKEDGGRKERTKEKKREKKSQEM
jgi:hypothetical protein